MNALTARMLALKPLIKGEWMPLYFEPILMSGERITIAVAAISENNDTIVFNTLQLPIIKAMYKERAEEIIGLIDFITDSLRQFVIENKTLRNWIPPLTGVIKGKITPAEGIEFKHIVNQGIRASSSLSVLYTGLENVKEEKIHERVTTAVKDNLISINKEYRKYLNKPIDLNDTRKRHYSFLNPNFTSNIVIATNGSYSINSGLVKVMDIIDLRSEPMWGFKKLEIIITKPLRKKMDEAVSKQIQDMAMRYNVPFFIIDSTPIDIAQHIHEKMRLAA